VHAPLRVESLRPEHRARVAEIVRATGMFGAEEVAVAVELFDEGTGAAGDAYRLLGVFAGAELLGYACFGPTPATDRTHDLYWIAVDPRAQGTGAGTRLLGAVERRLVDDAARLLVVETSGRAQYAPTRAFYLGRGYTEVARVRDFYAPDDDRIVFTKRLSSAAQSHPAYHESPAAGGAAER
jgi:ribosomal protein S18 acetylase RimI-like enzyme